MIEGDKLALAIIVAILFGACLLRIVDWLADRIIARLLR